MNQSEIAIKERENYKETEMKCTVLKVVTLGCLS
jgi:hypothetical protein